MTRPGQDRSLTSWERCATPVHRRTVIDTVASDPASSVVRAVGLVRSEARVFQLERQVSRLEDDNLVAHPSVAGTKKGSR